MPLPVTPTGTGLQPINVKILFCGPRKLQRANPLINAATKKSAFQQVELPVASSSPKSLAAMVGNYKTSENKTIMLPHHFRFLKVCFTANTWLRLLSSDRQRRLHNFLDAAMLFLSRPRDVAPIFVAHVIAWMQCVLFVVTEII